MTQPSMPGINAINDTFDFVKKMWGGVGIPGMTVPTMSVEEINKKIAELKAVEAWLNINTSMLRGTIQALEVQSATLSAVQSIGAAMGAAMKPGSQDKPPFASIFSTGDAGSHSTGQTGGFSFSNWPSNGAGASPADKNASSTSAASSIKPDAASADSSSSSMDFGSAFTAPAAWWNTLQTQFAQAVANAMSEGGNQPSANVKADQPDRPDQSDQRKQDSSTPSAAPGSSGAEAVDDASKAAPKKRKSS